MALEVRKPWPPPQRVLTSRARSAARRDEVEVAQSRRAHSIGTTCGRVRCGLLFLLLARRALSPPRP